MQVMDAKTPDDEADNDAWAQRCDTRYKAWVQLRYHRSRQRFFDLADKLTKSATVLLAGTIFGQDIKNYLPYVAGAISALGLLALVFAYSDRKQLHKELSEQAAKLIGDIELVPAGELTPGKNAAWRADYARLSAKAPPPLKTLTMVCEREQAAAEGHPEHVALQPWLRRQLRHFV